MMLPAQPPGQLDRLLAVAKPQSRASLDGADAAERQTEFVGQSEKLGASIGRRSEEQLIIIARRRRRQPRLAAVTESIEKRGGKGNQAEVDRDCGGAGLGHAC